MSKKQTLGKEGIIYGGYFIQNADGTPVDENASFFVLRIDTDPHARKAAMRYATSVFDENPLLAESIKQWVDLYERKANHE
jgi:hypothetical protein